jgi:hypothetical protein
LESAIHDSSSHLRRPLALGRGEIAEREVIGTADIILLAEGPLTGATAILRKTADAFAAQIATALIIGRAQAPNFLTTAPAPLPLALALMAMLAAPGVHVASRVV